MLISKRSAALVLLLIAGGEFGAGYAIQSVAKGRAVEATRAADALDREELVRDISDAVAADLGVRGEFKPVCVNEVRPRFSRHVSGNASCGMVFEPTDIDQQVKAAAPASLQNIGGSAAAFLQMVDHDGAGIVSWCDGGLQGRWVEQGLECHVTDPSKRKPVICDYRSPDGARDEKLSDELCPVPAGWDDVIWGDKGPR